MRIGICGTHLSLSGGDLGYNACLRQGQHEMDLVEATQMPTCSVDGCSNEADLEVILYDFYPGDGTVFFERDFTCPYICASHAKQNEAGIKGTREPRSGAAYPFTNKHFAQGFTIYRPLRDE